MEHDRFYRQEVTYWSAGAEDDFGKTIFVGPVIFKGRWEEKTQELQGSKGSSLISKAIVHVPDNIAVEEDDYLFLGASIAADPTTIPKTYKVLQIAEIPNLRNLSTVKIAYL